MTVRGAMMRTPNVEVRPMARKAQLSLDYAVDLWLNALAKRDAGDVAAATQFTSIAIALFEVAEVLEHEAA